MTDIIEEIICFALAPDRSAKWIYKVLDAFYPDHEKLDGSYALRPGSDCESFKGEDEIIEYYSSNTDQSCSLYWNSGTGVMVGCHYTEDGGLILSLTFSGTKRDEKAKVKILRKLIDSKQSMVSYFTLPACLDSAADFRTQCEEA